MLLSKILMFGVAIVVCVVYVVCVGWWWCIDVDVDVVFGCC